MKQNLSRLALLALVFLVIPALVILDLSSCAGPSPWLRPQGELVQLERQAAGAKGLATDLRTRAGLDLCILSAQAGVHAIDRLLGEQEKLRQARKLNAAIPELERSVAVATTEAEEAEARARTDCRRAGVSLTAVRAPAAPDGGAGDAGPAPHDAAPAPPGTPSPGTLPSPHQPPAAAPDLGRAAADGGAR